MHDDSLVERSADRYTRCAIVIVWFGRILQELLSSIFGVGSTFLSMSDSEGEPFSDEVISRKCPQVFSCL